MRDFTLDKYEQLLEAFKSGEYEILTFDEYLSRKDFGLPKRFVILRHDVDKKPANSLKTAELEYAKEIKSTYFFRIKSCSFRERIVRRISQMGHEIGYHYEDLVLSKGDKDGAIRHFADSLKKMRVVCRVKTICMHGSPLSAINSKDLWHDYDYKDYDVKGDVFFDVDYDSIYYITDTGRKWDGYSVSRRDNVPQQMKWVENGFSYHSTDDVIRAIREGSFPSQAMMTTHPQRWAENWLEWVTELLMQNLKNLVKSILLRK